MLSGILYIPGRIQGFQRQGDGKGCTSPESSGFRSEVGELANLFPRFGVG